jgi:anaerobic magnesium-protoporphyrin IX monomethyl ester cyclase
LININYNDVILIFPPQWSVLQPYLSLPSLTAYLRKEGISVNQYDLNIDFFHEVLSKEFLEPMCNGLKDIYNDLSTRSSLTPYEQSELYRIFLIIPELDYVLSEIENAKRLLQSDAFYNLEEKSFDYSLINTAFNIINLYCYAKISFDTMEFPVDTDSLDEIANFIRSKKNPLLTVFCRQVEKIFSLQSCKVAGISITDLTQLIPALTMAAWIKENRPDVHMTLGGNLLTRCAEGLVNRKDFFTLFADSVVIYEGEQPLLELVRAVKAGESIGKVPNLLYLDKEVIITGKCMNPDINSLPTPDFDGLDFKKYFSPKLIIPLLTSRGCYWGKCTFCDHSYIYGKYYQERNIGLVVDDLRKLQEKYGADYFSLADEAISPQAAKHLSDEIIRSGIKVKLITQARLEAAFSEEICKSMYDAGFRWAFFGLESGSEKILKRMNKGIDIKNAGAVIKRFHNAGILVHLFILLGFPGETEQDRKKTTDFVLQNSENILSVGASIFSLGRFSVIGRNPSMYDIKILPRQDDDTLSFVHDFEYITGQSKFELKDMRDEFMKMAREKLNLSRIWPGLFREQLFLYTTRYSYSELERINQNYESFINNLVGISRGTDTAPGPELKPRLRKGNYLINSKFNIVEIQQNLQNKSDNNIFSEDSWILYNFYGQECIRLNHSAGFLVGLCDGEKSIEQISVRFSDFLSSNVESVREVVMNFFNDFKINRLLEFN